MNTFRADGNHPHFRAFIKEEQLLAGKNGLAGTAPEQP
jgi:hypothetical protein